jgi:tRNA (guanine37-N1)-methyltransferase
MTLDVIGSIAIFKFPEGKKKKEKLKQAKKLLKKRKNIKTVLEKSEKVKGKLRTIKTRYLAGEKTLETIHKENNCLFKLNVEKCYFSPRLSEERKQVAEKIKKKDKVLVLFSGVAPFPIVIEKISSPKEITAVEMGRQCHKYAKENIEINKMQDKINLIQGDVKKQVPKLKNQGKKFDVIVMPRPNLKDTFLKEAFQVVKKGTRIFYYCFCHEDDLKKELMEIKKQAKKAIKKIKILRKQKAGDIAPYKYRYRVEFKIS